MLDFFLDYSEENQIQKDDCQQKLGIPFCTLKAYFQNPRILGGNTSDCFSVLSILKLCKYVLTSEVLGMFFVLWHMWNLTRQWTTQDLHVDTWAAFETVSFFHNGDIILFFSSFFGSFFSSL